MMLDMTNDFDLSKLDGVTLTTGHHDITTGWAATGDITDMPACVHPTLARHVQQLNDALTTTEADRWRIVREGGPMLVGSSSMPDVVACLIISGERTVDAFLASLATVADLTGADLTGADLTRANLTRADLTGARYDTLTRWPVGFNVASSRAILTNRS